MSTVTFREEQNFQKWIELPTRPRLLGRFVARNLYLRPSQMSLSFEKVLSAPIHDLDRQVLKMQMQTAPAIHGPLTSRFQTESESP
jgi:hypothetical protein